MRSQSNGLRLPQALLDQLDETQGIKLLGYMTMYFSNITLDSTPTSSRGRGRLRRPKLSRKEDRKQAREEKRQRKAEYFSSSGANSKRVAASPHPDSPPPKKTVMAEPLGSRSLDRESKAKKNPSKLRSTVPILPRSFQEEDEGRYIALLESKLSSGKRSKNGAGYFKDIENDGLGGM
jgi:nucleolar MIF4G domain-containing protein 1